MPSAESKALSPEFRKKLEYLRVVARSLQTGRFAALQRSKKLGRGIEFCDHRPYSPGDEFKDIDWNLYGRLDRFMVRLAREETELNLHLVVDCSASMSEGLHWLMWRWPTSIASTFTPSMTDFIPPCARPATKPRRFRSRGTWPNDKGRRQRRCWRRCAPLRLPREVGALQWFSPTFSPRKAGALLSTSFEMPASISGSSR